LGFLEQVAKQNFFDIKLLKIYIVSSSTDKSDLLKAEKYDLSKVFAQTFK
jgi:hypothetical protein